MVWRVQVREIINHVAGEDVGPVDRTRSVIQMRVRRIDQQAALVDISAVCHVRIGKRLAPGICELRVQRLNPGPEQGLQGMVVGSPAPERFVNTPPTPCPERTKVSIVRECEIQTLRGWNQVRIRVIQQVKAPISYVGQLHLRVTGQLLLVGEVPLPRVRKRVSRILTESRSSPERLPGNGGVSKARV